MCPGGFTVVGARVVRVSREAYLRALWKLPPATGARRLANPSVAARIHYDIATKLRL
jgi:hypothetical protein